MNYILKIIFRFCSVDDLIITIMALYCIVIFKYKNLNLFLNRIQEIKIILKNTIYR